MMIGLYEINFLAHLHLAWPDPLLVTVALEGNF